MKIAIKTKKFYHENKLVEMLFSIKTSPGKWTMSLKGVDT